LNEILKIYALKAESAKSGYQQSRHFIPCEVNWMRKKSFYQLVMLAHEYPFE